MRIIAIPLMFLALVTHAYATPQAGDEMNVETEGKKSVHGFTLGDGAARLVEEWRKKKNGYYTVESSANWGGCDYRLILKNNRLYLTSVFVDSHDGKGGILKAEIPVGEIYTRSETFADWFTGDLHEYFGDPLGYTHVSKMVRTYRFKAGQLIDVVENETEQIKKVEKAAP